MPKLHIGRPLKGYVCNSSWSSMDIFDHRKLFNSLLVGSFLAGCIALAWTVLDASSLPLGSPTGADMLLVFAVLLFAHEGLHLLGFPNAGLNSHTVIGIWPQIGAPYVQYLSPMSRRQFIVALLLPVVILSLLPLIMVAVGTGAVAHLSWISVLNCIGAGSDILIVGKLLSIVPANASVMESDGKLYWNPSI